MSDEEAASIVKEFTTSMERVRAALGATVAEVDAMRARLRELAEPTTETVPWAEAVGRVAARGNRNESWTIQTASEAFAHCRNGMGFTHDGTIEVLAAG